MSMKFKVYGLNETSKWDAVVKEYFNSYTQYTSSYSKCYQSEIDDEPLCCHYSDGQCHIIYAFFKRIITLPLLDKPYYDIITPYGFGGPIYFGDPQKKGDTFKEFNKFFLEYCDLESIVSEFIRIDPLTNANLKLYRQYYDVRLDNYNIYGSTSGTDEELLLHIKKKNRYGVRRGLKEGFEVNVSETTREISQFAKLYSETMHRHHQTGFLNFSPKFFKEFFLHLKGRIHLFNCYKDGLLLASSVFLEDKGMLHYFLAANRRTSEPHYASHIIIYKATLWARDNGFKELHLGGGAPSLIQFKKSMMPAKLPYYVATRITNHNVYTKLLDKGLSEYKINPAPTGFFFPEYRRFKI